MRRAVCFLQNALTLIVFNIIVTAGGENGGLFALESSLLWLLRLGDAALVADGYGVQGCL